MAKITCPDCGCVREYESNLDVSEIKVNRTSKLSCRKATACTMYPADAVVGAGILANSRMALMPEPTMQKGKLLLREKWETSLML